MKRVYTIGDCVLDILFQDQKPVESKPGGSILNSSVSLGRLGVSVSLLSELGEDQVGQFIAQFLKDNGVDTSLITRFTDTNTNLALAFLDENRNADYSFYKTRKGLPTIIDLPKKVQPGDIILFGSFLAIKKEFRNSLLAFLEGAREQGALIIYDPNFRRQHLPLLDEVMPYIKENMALAHIVKASNEDLELIAGTDNFKDAKSWMASFSNAGLVYTANKHGVSVDIGREYHSPVPQITPVSTIGAGDTFNAALVYYFVKRNVSVRQLKVGLSEVQIEEMVEIAITFSQEVCMRYDNFFPVDLAKEYRL
jgi:fructokinase